ncbi:hypothetical protein J7E62_09245 [Variovorax paradoxus]|nr:hypothetical protein [Variovorax paradoxus]
MSEPERLCRTCTHSRTSDGAIYTNENMAFCAHAEAEAGEPVNCPRQRFAESDEAANVCGTDAIFWEPRS